VKSTARLYAYKFLSVLLSGVIIAEIPSCAFAQALPFKNPQQEQKINYVLRQKYLQTQKFWEYDFAKDIKNANNALLRARNIDNIFRRAASASSPKPMSKKSFYALYGANLNKEYSKSLKEINSEKTKALSSSHSGSASDFKTAVNSWAGQRTKTLNSWRNSQIKAASAKYNKYISSFNNSLKKHQSDIDANTEMYIRSLAAELMAIYRKYPSASVRSIVLDVSPLVLMLKKNGHDLYSAADKNLLRKIYLSELKNNTSCEVIVTKKTTTWTNMTSPSVGAVSVPYVHKQYGLKSKAGCDQLLNAVIGLGLIGNGRDDGEAIASFMEKNAKTSISVPSMLVGASALLAMKQYGPLRGFVAGSIAKEDRGRLTGLPSLTDLVDIIAYNRDYLGAVSRYTQYPIGGGAMGNGWEDLAYMLAEDNTKESNEILNSFAINCTVFPGDFLVKDKMSCGGIRPFMFGAVMSRSKIANTYSPAEAWPESRQYFTSDGSVINQTDKQISTGIRHNAWVRANFANLAKKNGVSKGAFLAQWLYASDMGDVSVDTKRIIDNKIYSKYGAELSRGRGTAIAPYRKGDAIYNSKKSQRSTVTVIRNIATVADIALLVWALWDIAATGVECCKSALTLQRDMKLVRDGAEVAERASMITRISSARSLLEMRNLSSANAIEGLRFASGIKSPVLAEMGTDFSGITSVSKLSEARAAAETANKAGVIDFTAPSKITVSPAPKPLGISKTIGGARLFTENGAEVAYKTIELRKGGLLEINGVVHNSYKLKMPLRDLDFFIERLRQQGFYKYLHFDGKLLRGPNGEALPKAARFAKKTPISLELYDALGRPMNAFVRLDDSKGLYEFFVHGSRRIQLRGLNLIVKEKNIDVELSLPKEEFLKIMNSDVKFSRLPDLKFIYTKTKPVKAK